jgi:hypothetical protein
VKGGVSPDDMRPAPSAPDLIQMFADPDRTSCQGSPPARRLNLEDLCSRQNGVIQTHHSLLLQSNRDYWKSSRVSQYVPRSPDTQQLFNSFRRHHMRADFTMSDNSGGNPPGKHCLSAGFTRLGRVKTNLLQCRRVGRKLLGTGRKAIEGQNKRQNIGILLPV